MEVNFLPRFTTAKSGHFLPSFQSVNALSICYTSGAAMGICEPRERAADCTARSSKRRHRRWEAEKEQVSTLPPLGTELLAFSSMNIYAIVGH